MFIVSIGLGLGYSAVLIPQLQQVHFLQMILQYTLDGKIK
jgi:hypothetical protein